MLSNIENNFVAILTQERLLRLLQKHPSLKFDMVLIDEAHNLIENDNREILLECYSYILSEILITQKINYVNLFDFNISEFIIKNNDELIKLKTLAITRRKIKDFIIYITKQDYKLVVEDKVLTLSHNIENFIKYYNIGYIRTSLADLNLSMTSLLNFRT